MNTYLAVFLIATIASLTITPLVRRLCQRFNLLDFPSEQRRIHSRAVPRLGGIAVFASVLVAFSALPLVDNLLTQKLSERIPEMLLIAIPATLVLCLGIYDDLRGLNATVKFVVLGFIAALFYSMGGRIEVLAIPFIGSIQLPPVVAFLVTTIWLVGIANAFNLIDGVDGLASGAALFSSLVILVVSLAGENPLTIVVTLVLCGTLTGFLRYNFNPASIFLGDSGALFVGFILAALSVLGTQKATTAVAVITPILAFGLPVVDTGMTLARRMIGGRPLFQGDNEHIHHMLLARGWSQRHVVLVLYAVCAAFGLLAAISTKTSSPVTGLVLFVFAVAVIVALGHLRYHEVDEIKAGVKRTVGDRRIRVANNIRIRRASLALAKASSLDELFLAVRQMLEFEEFAYATVQLDPGRIDLSEQAILSTRHQHPSTSIGLQDGKIFWRWQHPSVAGEEVTGSRDFWSLRLPLSRNGTSLGWMNLYRRFNSAPLLIDTNYLSGIFRQELSSAAERVLSNVIATAPKGDLRVAVKTGGVAG
ncbi:MAG TPA: MraY family glycosyltransferase [Pyrinomonadaceae bacterium]|nr:MraY family glycosyltransferase [Pyrinomonadaceae bacterium]